MERRFRPWVESCRQSSPRKVDLNGGEIYPYLDVIEMEVLQLPAPFPHLWCYQRSSKPAAVKELADSVYDIRSVLVIGRERYRGDARTPSSSSSTTDTGRSFPA